MAEWSGTIEFNVNVSYTDAQTEYEAYEKQTWVISGNGTLNGSFYRYPAMWTTVGDGKLKSHTQNTEATWVIKATSPVDLKFWLPIGSTNKWEIGQWQSRVTIDEGMTMTTKDAGGRYHIKPGQASERQIKATLMERGPRRRTTVHTSQPGTPAGTPMEPTGATGTIQWIWRVFYK